MTRIKAKMMTIAPDFFEMLGLWGEPTDGPSIPHPAYGNIGPLCGHVVCVGTVHTPPAAFVEAALSGVVCILIVVVVRLEIPILAVSQLPARAVVLTNGIRFYTGVELEVYYYV